jgi:hypothetical protein
LTVIALLVIALPGCMPGEEEANAQSAAINDVRAKADSNAGQISGLTGRVGALEARATGEVSAASFAALQAQVNGLQTTIGAQEARIAELEADSSGSPDESSGSSTILSETKWNLRRDFSNGAIVTYATRSALTPIPAANPDDVTIVMLTSPRSIKIADVYEIVIGIVNEGVEDLYVKDVYLSLTFEPMGDVIVSDDSGIYQVSTSCDVYWTTEVNSSASTGICRRIKADTEEFNIRVKPDDTVKIELEFELIYS